jgi:DNA-directed RNA polymerase specialized sigma24 family protein
VSTHPAVKNALKDEDLEPLVSRTLAGDDEAWAELWLAIEPAIETVTRQWRVTSRLSVREDDRRNILLRVMETLRANGHQRLGALHEVLLRREAGTEGVARAWIGTLTRYLALNYAERHEEHAGDGERPWVELLSFTEEIEESLPESLRLAAAIDAHRIFACAEEELEPRQVEALRLWVDGHDHAQIAAALGLPGAPAADLLCRGAVMHLRRRFGAAGKRGAGRKAGGEK